MFPFVNLRLNYNMINGLQSGIEEHELTALMRSGMGRTSLLFVLDHPNSAT